LLLRKAQTKPSSIISLLIIQGDRPNSKHGNVSLKPTQSAGKEIVEKDVRVRRWRRETEPITALKF
jgi:hypothetical protein